MTRMQTTPDPRRSLAVQLGMDEQTTTFAEFVAEIERLKALGAARSYDAVDHEILRLDRSVPASTAPRRERMTAGEALVDAAVARGAIETADRESWLIQYEADPAVVGEIVERLPSDPELGERQFASDPHLRDLARQLDDLLGVPEENRVRSYGEPDSDGLPDDVAEFHRDDQRRTGPDPRRQAGSVSVRLCPSGSWGDF